MKAQQTRRALKNLGKKVPLFALCIAIVGLCLVTTFRHYTRFGQVRDLITRMETGLLDLRFNLRGRENPKNKIGILAIDEKALDLFGRWPISRRYYQQALLNLKKAGVRWIGFDAIFSEAEVATLEDAQAELASLAQASGQDWQTKISQSLHSFESMQKVAPGDQSFAAGLAAFEQVVLGYFYFQSQKEVALGGRQGRAFQGLEPMLGSSITAVLLPEGKELSNYPASMQAYGLVANQPILTQVAKHFAFFSNEADSDAIVRWVTLARILDDHLMPSLALKLAAEAMDRDILAVFDDRGLEGIDLVSRKDESDAISVPLDPYGQGRSLIKYRGPGQTFPHISLADAYKATFDEEQRAFLKDAVLLLGMTAIGINDQRPNPFDPAFDGVEIHATMVDNIMSQDFMRRPKAIFNIELLILLGIGLFFSPIIIFSRPSFSGLLGFGFLVGYYYFDKYYWFNKGVWAYMGMPFVEMFSLFISITLYKYIVEEREKRKVKGAFAHYLSPEVITQVLENPEALQLGGVRKELTVFFSDVRGFTTISESLTPEQLCLFMNEYFTPMTNIILSQKGVLDKYIGDAIMAFWGAPLALEQQADVAADAAIAMLRALDKLQFDFKAKGFPHCDIGIGLNTGPMSVGNMGSDERFCYTVMGDAVNLASRLEGLTKEYGIKVLISEFTVAKFTQKHHLVRDLDDIRVKGKSEPIKVFHLMRPDMLREEGLIRELIGNFEEGRKFYRAGQWAQATAKFQDCLKIRLDDAPSLLYLQRLARFSAEPPSPSWDGVYTFTHK